MKTKEQQAEEYSNWWNEEHENAIAYYAFLAGFQAATQQSTQKDPQ
jgi:hypothetical protein